jgi:hypothetical protein
MSDQGIAYDIYTWLLTLYNHGAGIQRSGTTDGTGIARPLLQEIRRLVPVFTILNTGTGTLYLGYRSTQGCTFPLAPGAFFSFEWTNPGENGLVVRDNGVTATTYEVLG